MSGMLEDLRYKVIDLETALVKLCRRSGHDEWCQTWPECVRHCYTNGPLVTLANEQCTTCKTFRCCEEEEAKRS